MTPGAQLTIQPINKTYCSCIATSFEGPWCANWQGGERVYCTLNGSSLAEFCPGAVKYKYHEEYWSSDQFICNKSKCKSNRI